MKIPYVNEHVHHGSITLSTWHEISQALYVEDAVIIHCTDEEMDTKHFLWGHLASKWELGLTLKTAEAFIINHWISASPMQLVPTSNPVNGWNLTPPALGRCSAWISGDQFIKERAWDVGKHKLTPD